MTEHYTYAPVERVVLTTAEFAALRDTAARLEAALLECVAQEAALRGERDELAAKLAEMTAEHDAWKSRAAQEKARREYDSVDAYNARINEAVRNMERGRGKVTE